MAVSAQATTVSVTLVGTSPVNNGVDNVLPYQLSVNGTLFDAVCYDLLDQVTLGQTWTANEFTLAQAAASGQFSATPNALTSYKDVGFLSQQTTASAQDQIDLQQDIWNIFAPGSFAITTGMQKYLDLLPTAAFTNFDFATLTFIEDVNSTGQNRVQAFVFDPPSDAPEPGTIALAGGGFLLIAVGSFRKRRKS